VNTYIKKNLLAIILALLVCVIGCSEAKEIPTFPKTYREFALRDNELPEIINSHPRLFIRQKKWKSGPSVEELRQWAKVDPLKSYLKRRPWNPKPGIEWAFRYLITGNEKLVRPIIEEIKEQKGYWPGYLTTMAVEYDWIYNSPSFKEEEKRLIEDKMVKWARQAVKYGERYHDIWSHYGYPPVTDLAAAGLALCGRRPEAKEFVTMAGDYMKKAFFKGWSLNDGAWQGGWTYYDDGPIWLIKLIGLWSSATRENLFRRVEAKAWLQKHLLYLISTVYTDGSPFDSVGFSFQSYRKRVIEAILLLNRGLRTSLANTFLMNKVTGFSWREGIWQFLYFAPIPTSQDRILADLPLSEIWGKEGVGYVQMRSGWGKDDTIIEFKCGDYFWSHQFQNQNSFYIYKKERLTIQSGIYDSYWRIHTLFYYRPTVSSNTILIVQPGEVSWVPPKAVRQYSIPNRGGYINDWGGQRVCYTMPKYGSAETCFSFEKYLYRKDHQHHFETGDIKAYEVTDKYTYVYGDATDAYNNPNFSYPGNKPKLKLFSRELVFLDKKYLVVFDRVESLKTSYEKKWLLHTIGEPEFLNEPEKTQYPGHIETYPAGLVRIDNRGGTLFCQTLFPENYLIRKVGGGSTVTECNPDKKNRGNAKLEVRVEGKYKRLSSTIATDKAQVEDWTIEFVENDKFKVVGSKTCEDGTGILSKKRKGVFISKSEAIFIPEQNWEGNPRKGDKFYFSVTSPSFRFWVNGKNYAPRVKKMYQIFKDGSHVDPGNWRIEVFPKHPQRYDTFLHFLYPCDRETERPPVAKEIKSEDGNLIGLVLNGWVVMFPVERQVSKQFQFSDSSVGLKHVLILGVRKGFTYKVSLEEERGKSIQKIKSSKEGTLLFDVAGPSPAGWEVRVERWENLDI